MVKSTSEFNGNGTSTAKENMCKDTTVEQESQQLVESSERLPSRLENRDRHYLEALYAF